MASRQRYWDVNEEWWPPTARFAPSLEVHKTPSVWSTAGAWIKKKSHLASRSVSYVILKALLVSTMNMEVIQP